MQRFLISIGFLIIMSSLVGCTNDENQEQLEFSVKTNWGNKMLHERNFYQIIIKELSSEDVDRSYLKGVGANQRDFYNISQRDDKNSIQNIMDQYYEEKEINRIIEVLKKAEDTSSALAQHLENGDTSVLFHNKQFLSSLDVLIKEYVDGKDAVVSTEDLTLINIIKYPKDMSENYSSNEILNLLINIEDHLELLSQEIVNVK
ncbi:MULTISPECIES: hypothetical protein [Pontibacillus]|uniref:Uncharacterized protein n=1 Tax=Pontibacillus chungwhensis TaxID=265426 RepID=A0ABY8V608_9BACI|nr:MULTISPECIES: hypothetical protein [Pontibacillus]MCD5324424.1 hypothetical protein [Pontibacillus sp. HN14]WIF99281.1 hypothetical protein QNI29_06370 [Pontibacillus chungwhensis]